MAIWQGRIWIAAALLGLTACGNGGSAVETRDRSGDGSEAVLTAAGPETESTRVVREGPQRLFERNGADFGAATAEDYLAKVRAFTTRPPAGTDRVERPNGDVLLYQASTNTFAVVSRDGIAKTMFKPRDGSAYWDEQKSAAPDFGRRRAEPSGS